MTLTRTGPRSVSSDDGFAVDEEFPERLVYRDGARRMSFSAELTAYDSRFSILLFDDANGRRWEAPHRDETISETAYREILVRVNAALAVLGIRADWQTLPPERDRGDWAAIRSEAVAPARGAKSAWI